MYAIIETGGKQYKVSEGDQVFVEKLDKEEGNTVDFDKVLAFSNGEKLTTGTPYLKDVKVSGNVVKNGKGKKIIVFKFKAKKNYKKTQGHRQPYTCVEITSIKEAAKKTSSKTEES